MRQDRVASEARIAVAPPAWVAFDYARCVARPEVTRDALLGGALILAQPRLGYRVNIDSIILAAFASHGRVAKLAIDLGAGVGALGLMLARVRAARTVVLVEREPVLVELARQNLVENAVTGSVIERDLDKQGLPASLGQKADLVVCNPPFYPPASGTPARHARHSRSGELAPFLRAARRALSGPRTRAAFCYPAGTLCDFLVSAEEAGLVPKRLRLVHARASAPARLALVELRIAKPGGLVVEPPLVEWVSNARSGELKSLVAGGFGLKR
jgi:tRNA1Val (adenine37-N6)-methyltransferase